MSPAYFITKTCFVAVRKLMGRQYITYNDTLLFNSHLNPHVTKM